MSFLLNGKIRCLTNATIGRFLNTGTLTHTPVTFNTGGDAVAGTPVDLVVRYQKDVRRVQDANGVFQQQDVIIVMADSLRIAAADAGLAGFVANTDDLDATFTDDAGNIYDTGAARIDPGDAAFSIDIILKRGG